MILILTCCALSSIMIKSIELRLIGADAKPQASFELFERIFAFCFFKFLAYDEFI